MPVSSGSPSGGSCATHERVQKANMSTPVPSYASEIFTYCTTQTTTRRREEFSKRLLACTPWPLKWKTMQSPHCKSWMSSPSLSRMISPVGIKRGLVPGLSTSVQMEGGGKPYRRTRHSRMRSASFQHPRSLFSGSSL